MPESIAPRILRHVDVTVAPRAIAPPTALDDPAVDALVEREASRAYAQGFEEGQAQGRQQAEAAATALASSVEHALATALQASAALADELSARLRGLAIEVAEAVVGELDPSDNGLVNRIEQALRVIDDRPLTVEVGPDDLEAVQRVCPPEVEVVAATDLARGEARVAGKWADADLTWQAVWSSVREVLDAE